MERTHERTCGTRATGLRRPQAAVRSVLTDHFQFGTSPQPSGWACTSGPAGRELQPSARGRLRAAAVPFGTANSKFKIQNSGFTNSGCSLRRARQRRQGAAGLRRRRLRPADPCGIESDGKALYSHQSHKKAGRTPEKERAPTVKILPKKAAIRRRAASCR